ncbi:MAG: GNAT family N-acetyltransferase [Bacteroidetes bacterium]|nr:GNAT family N-acetyltransferase [Bacteroidota bacterium]
MDFKLRPIKETDIDNLVKFANNPKIAANLTNKFAYPYTKEHGLNFIQFAMSNTPAHVMAITINDELVGGIGIHPQEDIQCKNAELGYWLAEPFWGNGIISKAIPQMVEYGFKTFDINRIFARPFGSNYASQKVLEKAGFKLEARLSKTLFKNGEFQDELIYAIRKAD